MCQNGGRRSRPPGPWLDGFLVGFEQSDVSKVRLQPLQRTSGNYRNRVADPAMLLPQLAK